MIGESFTAALALWIAGAALWAVLVYTVLAILTVKPEKPPLAEGINGGWLLAVVAAQSVSVLGAQLAPGLGAHAPEALVFSLAMWLGGGMPFVRGLTLMWWATATWWIPMLAILGVWRHALRRFPLCYDPLYWGAVFPLGMYTVCTWRLSLAVDAPFLAAISQVFVYVALAAWCLVAAGLAWHLAAGLRARRRP